MSGVMIPHALRLAAHNLAVFPVGDDCRRPWTRHGYKDASNTPEGVEALWRGRPEAMIAVATGAMSRAYVLDVDVKGANGLRTLAELKLLHGPLPPTWRTATPSGGEHIWFRQPDRRLRNRVGFLPGLDVRTDGGSVAAPPSRRHDGGYSWKIAPWDGVALAECPAWLLNIIDPPPGIRPPRPPMRFRSVDRAARYVEAAIAGECREVAATPANGGRNCRLFRAAAKLGALVGAGLVPVDLVEDALEDAAIECGLVQDDGRHAVMASIASGLRRGETQPREVKL